MHRGYFVWTPTPPLCGSVDATPGSHAGVRALVLPSRVGRAGLPGAFWCASPSPLAALSLCFARLLPGWCCPFLGPLLVLPLFPLPPPPLFFLVRAPPFVSCFLWFPALGALGPGALFFFPPPRPVFFFCAPLISGFLSFPASGALGLGAVCCLFCWPPASRLSVLSRLACVSRPAVGCSLVFAAAPPPPLSCLAVFVAASRCSVFFSLCAPVVFGFRWFPGSVAPGLGAVGFSFVGLPLLCSPSALASFVYPASPLPALWWLLPPPRPLFGTLFSSLGAPFFVFFFRCFVPSLSLPPLSLAFSGFRPRMPLALALCAVLLVASHFSARCALSPLLCFPPGPWLLPGGSCTPPPSVSRGFRRALPVPGFFFLSFFFLRPRVSSFLWFPAPGALGLGAVCCLFCWPPASRLAVRSRLSCVSRLAVGCSLVVAPPPPPSPFVSRGFRRCLSVLGFFFFVVRLRCRRLPGFRPRVPWALALCVVCFPHGRLWRPVFCFLRRRLVWCCGLWCVLCCAWCCVACLCLIGFLRRVAVGLVVLFLLCFAVERCCVLCWFLFFSWSLAFRWCSVLFPFLCFACALRCLSACGVALCALLSCPCCAGWCFVLLSVVFACLLLGLAVLCCLLLGRGGSWCRVSVMCCGVSLGAVLRRIAACRGAWRCVVVCCVVLFCSAWCCRAL